MNRTSMYLLFILITLVSTTLFAYEDSDMDGVDDKMDKCPNTSFNDLVDIRGCTIKSLEYDLHYDVVVGISYADLDYQTLNKADTLATSIQADYYYNDFSFQAATSYFVTEGNGYDDNGMYDSFLGVSYKLKTHESLYASIGAGLILPTYNDSLGTNNTDLRASANISYMLDDDVNIFAGYAFTIINDDDVRGVVKYQNTKAFSFGAGKYIDEDLYVSASYNFSNSIYTDVEDIKSFSLYANYTIDDNWFYMFNYAYGLSDSTSQNYLSLRLGYYF